MGTIEIIVLVLTIIKELAPYIRKLIDDGKLDPQKAPEVLIELAQGIAPIAGGMVIKNNPEWEAVVNLITPLLGNIFTDKE